MSTDPIDQQPIGQRKLERLEEQSALTPWKHKRPSQIENLIPH